MNSNILVIGGGKMGAGICVTFLSRGYDVALVETAADRIPAIESAILADVAARAPQGAGTFSAHSSLDDAPSADLVIEAVPESIDLKSALLPSAQGKVAPGGLLVSNTSSLSITALSRSLPEPAAFLGMHFFQPVPDTKLVELVHGEQTSPEALDRGREWVDILERRAIIVRDSPGFATSRLGIAIGLEAMRMVEEGVASPEDIDAGMLLGYQHQVGPLRMTDMVGLDVRLAIAEHLARELGPRFEPPQILRDKVAAGELGQKSGRGFFDWTNQ